MRGERNRTYSAGLEQLLLGRAKTKKDFDRVLFSRVSTKEANRDGAGDFHQSSSFSFNTILQM
jgi:hypothetical protein